VADEWQAFTSSTDVGRGDRVDDFVLVRLQGEVHRWLRQRGYPHSTVSASIDISVDTMAIRPRFREGVDEMVRWLRERSYDARVVPGGAVPMAFVQVKLYPGPLARYDSITVVGAERVEDRVLLRELPFEPGDRFRESDLTEGQRQIFGLNLFQLAAVDVAPGQEQDSTVNIRVTVTEAPARTLSGRAGFFSESGATGEAEWTHRDFLGDARAFTASLQAWTGVGAFPSDGYPDRRYRAGVSLRQPYVLDRRFSAIAAPYVEYRDDEIETSRQAGLDATLLYESAPLRTAALTYAFSRRAVLDQPGGGLLDPGGLLFDSLLVTRGELRLTAAYGRGVDDPLNPRRGIIVRPLVAVAGLAPGSVRYGTATLSATALYPFGRRGGVVARVGAGFLQPFAGTDPDNFADDYTGVRDVLMYAGGTSSVRGWGSNLLGPKFFDIRIPDPERLADILGGIEPVPAPDTFYSEVVLVRPYYLPIGGQRSTFGSLQINLPLPLGPNWGANAFVDAGRVWDPAAFVFTLVDTLANTFPNIQPVLDQFRDDAERMRVGVGAGIQYLTPVGFLSLAVGYKVNPSYADLRRPEDIWRELDIYELTGEPPNLDDVEPQWVRRLQFHLAIGQRF
jgi:outer membrane protein insertion porin family